jgi:hypothetical protein
MLSGEAMNLSQSVLPRARMTVPRRSPADRAILLAWLAKRETETPGLVPPAVISDTLAANAAESLTEEALEEAWQRYVEAVRLCEGITSGEALGWGFDLGTEKAARDEALRVLLGGSTTP